MFAGVEGGSTGSKMVLVNAKGEIVARSETGQTNQWQIGLEACVAKIRDLLDDCRRQIGHTASIDALGLGLSGLDTEESCENMRQVLARYNLASHYTLVNDTVSTLATATNGEGVVLIAGTGSNCLVMKDGRSYRCGGWGHMLGDEGSAYDIAHSAIKILVDHEEGYKPSEHCTNFVANCIKRYFNIENRMELLQYLYDKFEKSNIANLTKDLVEGAKDGDALCQSIFYKSGLRLGRHVQGVLRISNSEPSDMLTVVCTGGVFKSFDLIKTGFVEGVLPAYDGDVMIHGFKLVELKETAAVGAAYLAAQDCGETVVHHYDELSQVFYTHELEN